MRGSGWKKVAVICRCREYSVFSGSFAISQLSVATRFFIND